MQIPLASGTYTDVGAEFRTSYPRNLVPVLKDTGISKMFMRTAEGLTRFDAGNVALSGMDRGGINWLGTCYRVIGSSFVSLAVTGAITLLGTLPDDGLPVALAYGFENQGIGIVTAGELWFYTTQRPDGSTGELLLQQCVDPDAGAPIDLLWMGGYFVMSDGAYSYVTDLDNQFNINSAKYGSDSNSADPLNGLLKFRNELYLCNRYTISVMDNAGGTGYPFQENIGATIQKGVIGPHAKTLTSQGFAFVGGAVDEAPSVYLSGGMGVASKIATREVEMALGAYASDSVLYQTTLEYRAEKEQEFVYLHLPNQTFVYDVASSQKAQTPIWFMLDSSSDGLGAWRAWHPVYCYGRFLFGDKLSPMVGRLDGATAQQYGQNARWQLDTIFTYNAGRGVVVNSLELIGTYGRAALGENDTMSLQWSDDGLAWSTPRFIQMGKQGQTQQRAQWRPQHFFRNFRAYRFAGFNAAPASFAALEASAEALAA